jgi:hypothetical protein
VIEHGFRHPLCEESIRTEIKIKNYIEKEKNLTLGIKITLKYLKFYMNIMANISFYFN